MKTYDDIMAGDDQSFSFNNSDNAYAKMNGTFLDLTGNYYFMPASNIQPYLLLGIGMDFWTLKDRATDASLLIMSPAPLLLIDRL